MKKLLVLFFILPTALFAQDKYFTKSGKASFYSSTSVEDIEATNKSVTSVFDAKTGKIEFSMLVRSFEFEKALMEEHFNENYMESEKYPKATFKGDIVDLTKLDLKKDGTYDVKVKGKLTIHNVTKDIEETAKFTVKDGKISAKCDFKVKLKDYGIEDPSMIGKKIAEEISIKISISEYQVLKK
jgi:polyisoprenoid-binding protein YceI